MRLRSALAALLAASAGFATAAAGAQTVTLAGDSQWRPFYGPEMEGGGPVMRLVKRAYKRAGYEPEIRFLPWSRAMGYARQGDIDLAVGAYYTEARARDFAYSEPFLTVDVVFIARRELSGKRYDSLRDLAGYRIAIVQDNAYTDEFDRADYLDKIETPSRNAQVRRFFGGSLDLLVDPLPVFAAQARELGFDPNGATVLRPPLVTHKAHLIASDDHPHKAKLLADFNRALAALRDEGTYEEIMAPVLSARVSGDDTMGE